VPIIGCWYIPHVVQPCSSLPLLRPLYNFHTLDVWTEDLHGHLHANPRELISQKERSINAPQTDTETHTREWVSVLECHTQNVAHFHASGVSAVVKQSPTLTCGVKSG
jgi:hypothetical protein